MPASEGQGGSEDDRATWGSVHTTLKARRAWASVRIPEGTGVPVRTWKEGHRGPVGTWKEGTEGPFRTQEGTGDTEGDGR